MIKKSRNLILITIPLLITGCAGFINNIDDDLLNQNAIPYKKTVQKVTYCVDKKKNEIQLINDNKKSQQNYKQFIKHIEKETKLNFIEKTVLWSLIQMNTRPDLSSPSAKLHFFLKYRGESFYFNYLSKKEDTFPYLYGLNSLIKKFKTKHNLYQLAQMIDQFYSNQIYVTPELEAFLQKHLGQLNAHKSKNYYIRGDESLKTDERIPKQKLVPLISKFYKTNSKDYKVNDYLFSYKRNNSVKAMCNYDLGLYSSSIYLIHDKFVESNIFGIKDKKNAFLGSSTQNIQTIDFIKGTLFFKGKSEHRSAAMCSFEFPYDNQKNLWMVSTKSRDPGQHLYHLMEYGLQNVNSTEQLDKMLRFSRHLFLKTPIRLTLESQRSSSKQLDELLKLNIPLYNADKLGKIWGYHQSKNEQQFIIDDRRDGSLSCNKK